MKPRTIVGTMGVWLLGVGVTLGQPAPPPGPPSVLPSPLWPQEARLLYEEIEIMRRILDRALMGVPGYAAATGNAVTFSPDGQRLVTATGETVKVWDTPATSVPLTFSPDGKTLAAADKTVRLWDLATGKAIWPADPHHSPPELHGPQGSYLKGHGVVYSVSLAVLLRQPAQDPKQPPQPLSEWERLRRELRGEKVEPNKGDGPREVSLTETLLKVLAENGRHFAHLPENESITVAVTLPRSQSCAQCHSATDDPKARPRTSNPGQSDSKPDKINLEFVRRKDEVRRHILLGDLHLKQGEHKQAVKAYEEAVSLYKFLITQRQVERDLTGVPLDKDVQADLELADLHNKLAQAYLAGGNKEQALRTLRVMAELAQRAGQPETPAKPPAAAPAALPAKLIISVPKKLLDQVGAGKLTFEQFRAAVTVEHLDFPPAEKVPAKK